MNRPLTERERLRVRLTIAAHEALRAIPVTQNPGYVLRGFTRHYHDNTAGPACYGKPPHFHTHYFTNHPQPIDGATE